MFPGTHARTTPEKAAIVVAETGDVVSYARLDERSTRLARVFREAGLRPGDHVAFLSDNRPEVFEVYWAALRSGLYVTGVNQHLSPDEAAYVVEDCGARVLVVSAAVADLAAAVAGRVPALELRLALGGAVPGFDSYEDALASVSAEPLGDQPCGADMLYSSGTTGRPKGVEPALPQRQVDEPGDTVAGVFGPLYGFGPDTVYYSPAPVYHAAPLRFGGMVHRYGGTLVLASRFDAEAALAAIERYRVTHGQFVPTMFVRMLKLPPEVRNSYDVSSLRVAVHAAAPCPVEVKQQMMDWWGPVLHEYYSSTEANGVTLIGPEEWLQRPGSVGRAGLGVVHVCDDEGRELPAGEVGTIWFERDEMPFAYHGDPARTAQAQHPAHPTWSTVGDVGYVDDEGYLFLTDRKAFTVITGGTNVYPQEVEDVLTLHPAVYDVAVIGVPDPDMGEVVKAVVQLPEGVEGGPALERELIDFVRSRIAHFKAPRSVDFVTELPRTPTGKLQKHKLKARYAAVAG
ncbi:fatty-acyl-CoA synthase [Geodermatophilus bullaregiensis]|uniref:acyl-CoA synthetase n=1 Tax=Geodermatophilus bullaregiensis TaxID=1564160 RepID=UPI00195A2380|nr:acyl-CoA synthetase [Geodermatophilus bullaregiensis]MBM7804403.1 fatty-acyl-CoA synthase [Geodermatophilus bullaregiensis]